MTYCRVRGKFCPVMKTNEAAAVYDLLVDEFCGWLRLAAACYDDKTLTNYKIYRKFMRATKRKLDDFFSFNDDTFTDIIDGVWEPLLRAFLLSKQLKFIKK